MSWDRERVLALHAEHQAGATLRELGEREGVSGETIRVQFAHHRLAPPQRRPAPLRRLDEAEARREEIIELYMTHGSVDAVAEAAKLPRSAVRPIIRSMPDRESYRRQGQRETYSRSYLLAALRQAHAHLQLGPDEPLTIPAYRQAARTLGLPSYDTYIHHFSLDDTDAWVAALRAAGLPANPPRGRRDSSVTDEQRVEAVVRFMQAIGGRGSYRRYRDWAAAHGEVSGPTVRQLGWNLAAELAQERLAGS